MPENERVDYRRIVRNQNRGRGLIHLAVPAEVADDPASQPLIEAAMTEAARKTRASTAEQITARVAQCQSAGP